MPEEKAPDLYWELREPAFPHRTWRIYFSGKVERWDGQLVNYREATEQEQTALFVSVGIYMDAGRELWARKKLAQKR